MKLSQDDMDALRRAVDAIDKGADLESSLGKVIRESDMEYLDYLRIMDLVRRIARRWGTDHMSAALRILEKECKG